MGYQRYMNGMSNGGSIYAADNATPITNEELQAHVPSLFAVDAHESRSDRFVAIPTINVVEGLRNEGFEPFFAQQAKTRIAGKSDFTKHVIRLRHKSLANESGEAFEIILVNANDGTSSYNMLPGFFRFVCMNGLFTGETFDKVRVRHSGKAIDNVIEGAYTVLDNAPKIADSVARFKGITLSEPEQNALAKASHTLRFPDAYEMNENGILTMDKDKAPITAETLLRSRRTADNSRDLWTTFNRIQENAVKGGQRGVIRGKNGRLRNARVRAVNGIDQATKLNQALWTLADSMAELKEGAQ